MCLANNVGKLVFTSTSAVTLIPYMGSTMAVIVNQTEAKAKTPALDSAFLIPGYPASKLRAEKLVSNANGNMLQNGKGLLRYIDVCQGENGKLYSDRVVFKRQTLFSINSFLKPPPPPFDN